ncbi:hypothetical protein [Candidatus Mycoplasma haematobovis]|nr:hypothetical protein [Candidatus Mycoplasma haematobovis]
MQDLNNFKKQCRENGRKSFTDENDKEFIEVKKYCTRKIIQQNHL